MFVHDGERSNNNVMLWTRAASEDPRCGVRVSPLLLHYYVAMYSKMRTVLFVMQWTLPGPIIAVGILGLMPTIDVASCQKYHCRPVCCLDGGVLSPEDQIHLETFGLEKKMGGHWW